MWPLHFLLKKSAAATLKSPIMLFSKLSNFGKEGKLSSSSEVINFHLETYAKDNLIPEMDSKILSITQPSSMTLPYNPEALWNKALLWDLV